MEILKPIEFVEAVALSIGVSAAFPLGALISVFVTYPGRIRADLGAFAAGIFFATVAFSLLQWHFLCYSGIFFATVAFSLVDESIKVGRFTSMIIGFAVGAVTFSFADRMLKVIESKSSNAKYSWHSQG